jgi:SAM-dependent methyltransferase
VNEFRSDGYFSATEYIYGYYRELSPVFQRFCLLQRGLAYDDPGDAAVHCELGFGQGVSIAIHAAANPGRYFGTDFNPAHAAHARSLAAQSGADVRLYDDSFAQLLARDDLPAFDSISLHGIWSWINPVNRGLIMAFVLRHLKPGGLCYVSYNCLPGWSTAHPLRQVLALHDRYAEVLPDTVDRVEGAQRFAGALLAADPQYARVAPDLAGRLEAMKNQPPAYVAHEYLNREWHCPYFSEVADVLAAAKLDFATTAHPLDVLDAINLRPDGIAFLNGIAHPILREQMRDYFVNRQFRKDLYLRGARRLSAAEQREQMLATRIVLERPRETIALKLNGPQGEAVLDEATFRPLLDALESRDYAPKSLDELVRAMPAIPLANLMSACGVLVGTGDAAPCQAVAAVEAARAGCAALNRHLLARAQTRGDISHLASPVTGGGVSVDRFHQLFMLAKCRGQEQPAQWAQFAWSCLLADGQCVLKDGKALGSVEENLAELTGRATEFGEQRVPILRALEII